MAGFATLGGDMLEQAASASLPSGGSGTPTTANPQLEIIQKLLAASQSGQTGKEPLTTFGTQVPQAVLPPAPVVNAPQVPQGSFQSKGEAQRAQKQANFNNIASIVKQGVDRIHQQKVQTMSADITRLLGALDGLNEAKSVGNQDAIKHNTDIINMLLDPTTPDGKKRIKAFQKAFNINLLGESKDTKSPEYQGLVKAYKDYSEAKAKGQDPLNPIAQRLTSAMPQREQLNPALQAQAAAIKAGLAPSANIQMQTAMKQIEVLQKAKSSDDKIAASKDIAKLYNTMKDVTSRRNLEGVMARIMSQGQLTEFKIRAAQGQTREKIAAMQSMLDQRLALMDKIAGNKQDSVVFNKVRDTAKELRERIKNNANKAAKDEAELDKQAKLGVFDRWRAGMSNADIDRLRQDGLAATFENNDLKNQLDGVEKQMKLLSTLGLMTAGSASDPEGMLLDQQADSDDSDDGGDN